MKNETINTELNFINPMNLVEEFSNPKLIIHETVESIFYEHWNFEKDLTFEELLNSDCGGEDEHGNEIEMSMKDFLEDTRANGFWAYAATKENELHFWRGKLETLEEIMMILGHELGHLAEFAKEQFGGQGEDFTEEDSADKYGIVAVWAYRYAKQILEK